MTASNCPELPFDNASINWLVLFKLSLMLLFASFTCLISLDKSTCSLFSNSDKISINCWLYLDAFSKRDFIFFNGSLNSDGLSEAMTPYAIFFNDLTSCWVACACWSVWLDNDNKASVKAVFIDFTSLLDKMLSP